LTPAWLGQAAPSAPILSDPQPGDPGAPSGVQAVNALGDPRFDGTIVCVGGVCRRVPPPAAAHP
jgi:hypothetical protein